MQAFCNSITTVCGCCWQIGVRLGSPVLLRQLLRGLVQYASGEMTEGETGPQLWLWAALLACTGYLNVSVRGAVCKRLIDRVGTQTIKQHNSLF